MIKNVQLSDLALCFHIEISKITKKINLNFAENLREIAKLNEAAALKHSVKKVEDTRGITEIFETCLQKNETPKATQI